MDEDDLDEDILDDDDLGLDEKQKAAFRAAAMALREPAAEERAPAASGINTARTELVIELRLDRVSSAEAKELHTLLADIIDDKDLGLGEKQKENIRAAVEARQKYSCPEEGTPVFSGHAVFSA